jgi:hypothetical protein
MAEIVVAALGASSLTGVWEVFEEERPNLVPYRSRFDGFYALPASVSKTCLVRFDNNKHSVNASTVGRRCRSMRMPIASSFVRTGAQSRNMPATTDEARRSTIRGITSRSWPANLARSGTAPFED